MDLNHQTPLCIKSRRRFTIKLSCQVTMDGIEPPTLDSSNRRSTDELHYLTAYIRSLIIFFILECQSYFLYALIDMRSSGTKNRTLLGMDYESINLPLIITAKSRGCYPLRATILFYLLQAVNKENRYVKMFLLYKHSCLVYIC